MTEKWMDDLAEIVHVKCQANLDNERAKLAEVRDNLSMVQAVLETWAISGPMHPAAARLWQSVNAAARGEIR
jgi:phosphate-selective porin